MGNLTSQYQGPSKDYIMALSRFPSFIKLLDSKNKPYEKLYQWFIQNEKEFLDGSKSLPSVKEIAKSTNIEYGKIAGYLKLIYNDIRSLNYSDPDKFKKEGQTLYWMHFHYIFADASFLLGLNTLPRVGDSFEFWFIKPMTGNYRFFVKSVDHYYENFVHLTHISCTYERKMLYLQLLKEKAFLNNRISIHEFNSDDDYTLEEYLINKYSNL